MTAGPAWDDQPCLSVLKQALFVMEGQFMRDCVALHMAYARSEHKHFKSWPISERS